VSRNLRYALLAAVLGLVSAALGYAAHYWLRTGSVSTPAVATDFAFPDLAGKSHRLSEYRGKLVLVNFWATWCPPCRLEIPGFIRLQGRYRNRGFQILGISIDNPEAVARYWQDMKINYPLLLADDTAFALMGAFGNPTGGLPYSVLVRPDGGIVLTRIGILEESELEQQILGILPEK